MSSAMSKGILWGLTWGQSEYSLSWDLGQRIFYSKPQARGHSFHGLLGIPKMPQSFLYTKSSLGAQWRPLYITLLTLLVFSEMSYATLSFCTLQDNCREPLVNRIFSEVLRELWGPILPFLEMRKVLEHWGEACPALMYSGLMKLGAHVNPITLVLQPTILHSIFFFTSLKIQQQM